MDIVLFLLCTWWIAGILGLRPRRTRRRKRRTYWKPNVSPYDYEEYLRRNAR